MKSLYFAITLLLSQPSFATGLEDQFVFGFEPTRTNFWMLYDTGVSVLKKTLTGQGKGVLEIEGKTNSMVREKYIELVRTECPKCKIEQIRESHGTVSYKITYPDGFYLNMSLDAGALEWQTKPISKTELKSRIPFLQKEIFDRADRVGATKTLSILGGHVTYSGFANDTFLFSNYLKLRAMNPTLDWGFFGKDAYNANPVSRWNDASKAKYAEIQQNHDRKWSAFLKKLESQLESSNSLDEIINIFGTRETPTMKDFSEELFEVYSNPSQENALLGTRSKSKYVANKPGNGLIENRAILPQKTAEEFFLHAQFIEAELNYIKKQTDEGKTVQFFFDSVNPQTPAENSAEAKSIIQELKLDWNDYSRFAKVTNPTDVDTNSLRSSFKSTKYGAKKRDELFEKIFSKFISQNEKLSERQLVFLVELGIEMSLTKSKAFEIQKKLLSVIDSHGFSGLSFNSKKQIAIHFHDRSSQFRTFADDLNKEIQPLYKDTFLSAIESNQLGELDSLVKSVSDETAHTAILSIEKLQYSRFNSAFLKMHAKLILTLDSKSNHFGTHLNNYLDLLQTNKIVELPSYFDELIKYGTSAWDKSRITQIEFKILNLIRSNPALRVTEDEKSLLRYLSNQHYDDVEIIYQPLQKFYANQILKNGYGQRNYYKTLVYYEELVAITPFDQKSHVIQNIHSKVSGLSHLNPDMKSFAERVNSDLKSVGGRVCKEGLGVPFFSVLRRFFGA